MCLHHIHLLLQLVGVNPIVIALADSPVFPPCHGIHLVHAASEGELVLLLVKYPDDIRMVLLIFPEYFGKPDLILIANDQVHGCVLHEFPGSSLRITAGCHHNCRRIHFPGPVQHLAGFAIRNIGDGAGIDYINVRTFIKRDDLIALAAELLRHGFRLICIHTAAKGMKSDFFPHVYFLPGIPYRRKVTVHGLTAWQMTHSVRHGPLLLLNLRFCPRPCVGGARRL